MPSSTQSRTCGHSAGAEEQSGQAQRGRSWSRKARASPGSASSLIIASTPQPSDDGASAARQSPTGPQDLGETVARASAASASAGATPPTRTAATRSSSYDDQPVRPEADHVDFEIDVTDDARRDLGGRLDVEQLADERAILAVVGPAQHPAALVPPRWCPSRRPASAGTGCRTGRRRERPLQGQKLAVPGHDGAAHRDRSLPGLGVDDLDRTARCERRDTVSRRSASDARPLMRRASRNGPTVGSFAALVSPRRKSPQEVRVAAHHPMATGRTPGPGQRVSPLERTAWVMRTTTAVRPASTHQHSRAPMVTRSQRSS